ncbi:MAG: class IV adenylate cyclase [Gemmatimonadota bacterium]|nr:class IV adenylate cyclase [Gemmatimonadota bacterium]
MSPPTRELELKARVDDVASARSAVERAGAVLGFKGILRDRLYDSTSRALSGRDHVLRVRTYESDGGNVHAHLDWKGPTSRDGDFKAREELTSGVSDPLALGEMLARLGFGIVAAIDRRVAQYELAVDGECAVIRFEIYPRMDTLVEVEGTPDGIELGIRAVGIARECFTAQRLRDFVREYEARSGLRAATSDADV